MGNQKCAVIISGFPGVGKTALHGLNHDGSSINPQGRYAIYDVQTTAEDREGDYWQVAEELVREEQGAVVLVTASGDSHRRLLARGWRFVCVYPGVDLKDEYLRRYFDRVGIDSTWRALHRNWERWIQELGVGSDGACTDWELAAGEDLEDVLPLILAGVEDGAF